VVAVAVVAEAGTVTAAIAAVVAVGTAAGSRAVHSGIQVSNRGVRRGGLPGFFCPSFLASSPQENLCPRHVLHAW